MRFADLIDYALTSLGRRRLRSVLTTFGIFVGIVTIVTMVALAAGVQREVERNVADLGLDVVRVTPRTQDTGLPRGMFQAPRQKPITDASVAELKGIPGVVSAEPSVDVPSQIDLRVRWPDGETRIAPASSVRVPFAPGSTVQQLAGTTIEGKLQGVVLSKAALGRTQDADRIATLIGQPVTIVARTQRGETAEFTMTLVGVDDSRTPSASFAPVDAAAITAWWFDDPNILQTQGYDAVTLRASSIGAVSTVSQQVTGQGYQVNSVQAVLDVLNRVFAILQAMLAGVGGLSLFVAGLGVANTMLMAVYERTREIGIMKATGAARGDVLRLFLTEAGMMGAIGGFAGLTAGWLLSLLVDWIAHKYLETQQVTFIGSLSFMPWWLIVGSLAFAVFVGVVAGIYPAFRAASLDPVAALRHD